MKKYYKFVYDTIAESEKAFAFDYVIGYTKRKPLWIPKSICQFTELNEVGNSYVIVPAWFFAKNFYDYRNIDARFIDIIVA